MGLSVYLVFLCIYSIIKGLKHFTELSKQLFISKQWRKKRKTVILTYIGVQFCSVYAES